MSTTAAATPARTATGPWDRLRWALIATWPPLAAAVALTGRPGALDPGGWDVTVWGLRVPAWLAACCLLHTLTSLALLVQGPPPWRATRWAWFWLLGTPVALPLFLVLSGPTPGCGAPRDASRRLRGGWALVIAGVVSSVVGTVRATVT